MDQPVFAQVLKEAEESVRRQGRAALCQIVRVEGSTPGKPGWKLLVRPDGTLLGNLGGGAFEALVKADASAKLAEAGPTSEVKRYYLTEEAVRGEATGMICGGMAEVFLEVMRAPALLVVCGGGPVGQALARAGQLAGFETLVVEDRDEFLDPALFPDDTRFIQVDRRYSGDFLSAVKEREIYATVVTRCWETDTAALNGILRQAPPSLRYLGLMGSRRKVERIRTQVTRAGLSLDNVEFHAPIGLPIGGDSPGEIAISILAEILQVHHQPATQSAPQVRRAG